MGIEGYYLRIVWFFIINSHNFLVFNCKILAYNKTKMIFKAWFYIIIEL